MAPIGQTRHQARPTSTNDTSRPPHQTIQVTTVPKLALGGSRPTAAETRTTTTSASGGRTAQDWKGRGGAIQGAPLPGAARGEPTTSFAFMEAWPRPQNTLHWIV